jgi:hypothetical protein
VEKLKDVNTPHFINPPVKENLRIEEHKTIPKSVQQDISKVISCKVEADVQTEPTLQNQLLDLIKQDNAKIYRVRI